jgi:hypothetical protein
MDEKNSGKPDWYFIFGYLFAVCYGISFYVACYYLVTFIYDKF